MKIKIQCDGGCCPNPGRGYGSFDIRCEELGISLRKLRMDFGFPFTNNQAEYLSLLRGLQELAEVLIRSDLMGVPDGEICSDSKLLVNQMNKRWKCKHGEMGRMRKEAISLCAAMFSEWKAFWVPRDRNMSVFGH